MYPFLSNLINPSPTLGDGFKELIAVASGKQLGLHDMTPLLLTIAFASSADFLTPFGYQTNLMVFGPGGYKFSDYIRYGLIPTLIYMAMTIFGIAWWYNML